MSLLGLALMGILLGAAGSEILRVTRPDLVKKVEDSAKDFAESFGASKSSEDEPEK